MSIKKMKIYNKLVEIPLLLELLSRLRTELTGKYDPRMVDVNRMIYSIVEAFKYYEPKRENADKIIAFALKSYVKKKRYRNDKVLMVLKVLEGLSNAYREARRQRR